jgi:hypothetical protein
MGHALVARILPGKSPMITLVQKDKRELLEEKNYGIICSSWRGNELGFLPKGTLHLKLEVTDDSGDRCVDDRDAEYYVFISETGRP